MEHIMSLKLQQGECMISHSVKALFSSVLVDSAISIVKSKQDLLLSHRTLHFHPTNHNPIGVLPEKVPTSSSR